MSKKVQSLLRNAPKKSNYSFKPVSINCPDSIRCIIGKMVANARWGFFLLLLFFLFLQKNRLTCASQQASKGNGGKSEAWAAQL